MDRLQTMSGFAAAARRLNLSPPSVTRAVGELKARLGCRLFHRTTRSVHLTEAGERYLADCRRILAEIDEADRHAAGIHGAPSGRVRVTGSVTFGRLMLMPILLDLLDRYPAITVETLFVDRVVHLVDEGIDVAVRIAELADSSFMAVRVGSVRRVLCASPAYLDLRGRPASPEDLLRHELVEFVPMTPGGEWNLQHDGRPRPFRPTSRLRLNTADAAIAAALAGRGITRLLSYMIQPKLARGELEVVLAAYEPPAVPIHVIHKEPGQTSARVRAAVDFLVERLRAQPLAG